MGDDDDTEGWAGAQDDEDPAVGLEDGWFIDDDEVAWPEEDGGRRGPGRGRGGRDRSGGLGERRRLGGGGGPGRARGGESPRRAGHGPGRRAGLGEDHRAPPRVPGGPWDGEVAAVALSGSGVTAVGNGIFGIGADGMLHRRELIADLEANSVVVYQGVTFLGTRRHGAVAFMRDGGPVQALNGWNEMGPDDVGGIVSTELHLDAVRHGRIFRLLGCTGSGHVFCSDDFGTTWCGPVTEGRCLAVAVDRARGAVVTLEDRGARVVLATSRDLANWEGHAPAGGHRPGPQGGGGEDVGGGGYRGPGGARALDPLVPLVRSRGHVAGGGERDRRPGPGPRPGGSRDRLRRHPRSRRWGSGGSSFRTTGGASWARIFETDRGSPIEDAAPSGRGEISWIGVDGGEARTACSRSPLRGSTRSAWAGRPTAH